MPSGGSGGSTRDAGSADVPATSDTAITLDSNTLDGGSGTVAQQCLTGLVNPFATMAPNWANWSSSSCSSVAAADGSLVLTQHEPCSAASPNAIAGLAAPNVLCGDFDVQVDFAVTGLVSGVTGGIFASMRAHDQTVTTNGMTIERYAAEYPIPSSQSYQNYKSYTTNQGDDATSVFVPTTDVTGRFRLTRAGTTVKSYYWKTGAPDGQWVLVNTATLTNTPWVLVLYEGDNSAANKGPAPYSVTFSNLLISGSATNPSVLPVVIDAGVVDATINHESGASGGGGYDGGAGDVAGEASTDGGGGAGQTATMFLPDTLNNVVYRFTITPSADPTLTTTIPVTLGNTATVGSSGELFVAAYSAAGTIYRFLSPLSTPVANGTITGVGLNFPENMRFVDDELWVLNSGLSTTETQNIVRFAFDAQGNATVAGIVQTTGLIGADRGMLWNQTTRDLYVTQCAPVNTIQHLRVAPDLTVTALTPVTGNGLNNPHGMVITSWGELLVANAGGSTSVNGTTLLRFSLDAQGNATATGTVTGNSLNGPIGLALAPWGELYVINAADATIARFTFDTSHAAIPNGHFDLGVATQQPTQGLGVAWVTIVP